MQPYSCQRIHAKKNESATTRVADGLNVAALGGCRPWAEKTRAPRALIVAVVSPLRRDFKTTDHHRLAPRRWFDSNG